MFLTTSKIFLYCAVLSVLIVLPSTFFPFIGGKYYFFRVVVELALAFFVLAWAFEPTSGAILKALRDTLRRPLVLAVTVFAAVYLLAAIFAHDPNAAFWSNYERGEGAFQMLHYYAFFLLLATLFRSRNEWRRLFIVSLVAAGLMILYGFLGYYQAYGRITHASDPQYVAPFCWRVDKPNEGGFEEKCLLRFITPSGEGGGDPKSFWEFATAPRFQGSLGNPAYVAPYLIFSMFYALYLWGSPVKKYSKFHHIGFGALVAFFLLFFFISQTRAAALGLAVGAVAFLIYMATLYPKLRMAAGSILAFLIVLVGVLVAARNTSVIQASPLSRIISGFSIESMETRLWTWGSAWKGIQERPILGWGPENFSTVFDKHFDPRHYIPGTNSETWFDRAHSVVFDYLAETGIFGFFSYLALFVILYWLLVRRGVLPGCPPFTHSLLVALPIAYLVQGLALFDVLPIYINLFLFLAFASFIFTDAPRVSLRGSLTSLPAQARQTQ